MKLLSSAATLLMSLPLFSNPPGVSVFFETDEFLIQPEFCEALMAFTEDVDPNRDFSVLITGFADYRGSQAYNHLLAMRRAEAVRKFLEEQGLHPFELRVMSSGEEQSAQAGSEFSVRGDRRVEVMLKTLEFSSIDELHDALSIGNEFDTKINGATGGVVRSTNGTAVHIPAFAMLDEFGNPVSGDVTITLTEALSPLEYFTEGLTTVSGDRILETDGMIRIEAAAENGGELCLDPDAEMTILVPSTNVDPRMELFVSETGDDWDATGQANLIRDAAYEAPPVYRGPRYPNLRFVPDESSMPGKPIQPVEPRRPKEPSQDKYQPRYKWYDFLWRGKKKAQAKRQYDLAVERYETRMERYDKRRKKYEDNLATLDARKAAYEDKLDAWHIEQDCAREVWEKEVLEPALDDYQVRFDRAHQRYQEKYDAWRERRAQEAEKRIESLEALGELNARDVSGYVFKLNSFGWINCDYFLQDDRARQPIVINNDCEEKVPVVVAYTNAKSIIRPDFTQSGKYILRNVPKGEPATIISYKVEDGQVMMCRKELSHFGPNELTYEPISLRGLRETISQVMGV